MKAKFKFFSLALCACAFTACSDDDSDKGTGTTITGDPSEQYVIISSSGENNGAYLQQTGTPTTGIIDPTNPEGRIFFSGNNPDFVNYNNDLLIGMNYPSQGGSPSDYITKAWKLVDGKLTQHGNGVTLDGDVKARGIFKNYLIGMSDQTGDGHYERVKFINLDNFETAVVDGKINCENYDAKPASLMDGETWGGWVISPNMAITYCSHTAPNIRNRILKHAPRLLTAQIWQTTSTSAYINSTRTIRTKST